MQSYFSIAFFPKSGGGGVFISVIYRNKKERKELGENINYKIKIFKSIFWGKIKKKDKAAANLSHGEHI